MSSTPEPGAPPPPVWNVQTTGPATISYGGFWIRAVAYILDTILLSIASGIIGFVSGTRIATTDFTSFNYTTNAAALVVSWLYFALMESSARGATLGKMAVGLRVVTEQGQRLSFGRATGRYFAKFLSAIILFIGFIMVAFTDRKRGAHDMIAETLVIKVG